MSDVAPGGLRPGDLVAVAIPPGEAWIPLLQAIWDAGAAVLPVDHRLPASVADDLVRRARPAMLITSSGPVRLDASAPAGSDVGAVVATSGTTGTPRLVELTRHAIAAAVRSSASVLGATASDPWLCCIPVAHIGGLLVLLRHTVLGAPVSVHPGFSIEAVRDEAAARFVSVVPAQLRRLFDADVDCTRFRAMLVGGASLPPELAHEAAERGVNIVTTYGLTESCGGVLYNGRPLPGTAVRVQQGDEVQLTGSTLMSGYRFDADATSSAFTSDGWLRTRDSGTIESGVLVVHGRLDDVIVTGGEKVWPHDVESALAAHPLVAEVAVHGEADADWGQRVVAVVVPRDGGRPPAVDTLREHVAQRLPRYMAPREVIIVDSLARTALGKVRREQRSR